MKWADVQNCLFPDLDAQMIVYGGIARRANKGFSQNNHANELKTMIVRSAHLTVQLLVRGDEIWEDSGQFP